MSSTLAKALYLLLGLGVVVFLAATVGDRLTPGIQQPFPFNHAKHMKGDWKCANCHPFVDQQAFAGLPRSVDCVDCHEKEMPKNPNNTEMRKVTAWLRTQVAEGRDLPWVQVHRTARHVYFSHRRHVEVAKLDCKDCHGDVAKMTEPFTRPAFPAAETKKMNWCLRCHEQKKATTDCASCHR